MSIKVEVSGPYALFSRPEMKTERVSYDCMTPSAARGLLESIYWHPGLRWIIDRIHVCAPIHFTNIRRNEVKDTINARSVKAWIAKTPRVSCISLHRKAFSSVLPWCCAMSTMSLKHTLK